MDGLAREHDGAVKAEYQDATTPENRQKIQTEFGFKTHGLVIYGAAGELEQKLDGHLLKEPEIRKALDATLAANASRP